MVMLLQEEAQGQPVITPKVTIGSIEEVIKELEETEDPVLGKLIHSLLKGCFEPAAG